MKKLALFMGLLLSTGSMMAQSTVETVHLKNGGLIKGEIIEQVPGQSLKVKTKDGNIFVYQMDEVERITKEQVTETNKGHRGLDFNIDLGCNFPTKSGMKTVPSAELSLGKRFSKSFYWGLGGGIYIPTSGGNVQIPITTEAKMYFPLKNSKFTPFVSLKGGYVINTASDINMSSGKGKSRVSVHIKKSNYALLQFMPGVAYPLSGGVDFNLAVGYVHHFAVGGDMDGWGAIAVRAGFGFHKNENRVRRLPVPTRDKGFQVTLEGEGLNPWNIGNFKGFITGGANIVLGYKINPNISVGLGYGASYAHIGDTKTEIIKYSESWGEGDEISREIEEPGGSSNDCVMHKIFVRGQYRLNDNRFSPIAAVDLGIRKYNFSENIYSTYSYGNKLVFKKDDDLTPPKSAFFVKPSIGFSLRTTNNSYFEMHVGYDFSKGLKEVTGYVNTNNYYNRNRYSSIACVQKSRSLSGLFFPLGWTHTFGSRK